MRSGADFSGAIYSLDTGNRVFPAYRQDAASDGLETPTPAK